MAKVSSTIVALSSGSLPSGVAVIRISGPATFSAVNALCGMVPKPRHLKLLTIAHPQTGEALDRGLVAVFPAPNSFTGEDCAELQVHGSPAGVKATLSALTSLEGIVLAGAGDFTRRAFENGKLDLTAIEGLGDLLAAETEHQRRQALMRLEGGLSDKIINWRDDLLDARAEIEAHLDFSDEDDVPFELPVHFVTGLSALKTDLEATLASYDSGRIVREGFRIVLAGAPNAGKSSLLNALGGSDLAIVTSEAGTTRDTKDVQIDLGGSLVIITDTAGLRATDSLAEAEGIKRSHQAMSKADLVLWLVAPDTTDPSLPKPESIETKIWAIGTKADIGKVAQNVDLSISTETGEGVHTLLDRLRSHIGERISSSEPGLISHLRDRVAIGTSIECLEASISHIDQPELCAEDLRQASDVLAGLIGLIDSETVLDRLFAGFCIGK